MVFSFKALKLKNLTYLFLCLMLVLNSCGRQDESFTESDIEIPNSELINDPTQTTSAYKMSGIVESEGGLPLGHTEVNLYQSGVLLKTTSTNESGAYTFEDLASSEQEYFVETINDGFKATVKSSNIEQADEEVNFILVGENNPYIPDYAVSVDPTDTTLVTIEGSFLLDEATPASGVVIVATDSSEPTLEASLINYAISDNVGYYEMLIPSDIDVKLSALNFCDGPMEELYVGPYITDETLPDYYVENSTRTVTLIGELTNCDGNPIESAIVTIEAEYGETQTHELEVADGDLSLTYYDCGIGAGYFTMTILDTETGAVSTSMIFNGSSHDFGSINICNPSEPESYFHVTVNDVDYQYNNIIAITSCFCEEGLEDFTIVFSIEDYGPYLLINGLGEMYSLENNTFGNTQFEFTSEDGTKYASYTSDIITTITQYDLNINGFIQGSFEGNFNDALTGEDFYATGNFRALIQ